MPGIVTIEWDNQILRGVAARASQRQLQLTGHFVFAIPESLQFWQEPEQAGRWLHEQLRQAGVNADTAMISLPHDAVIVRHFELPKVPAEQLAALVRLQIETNSPDTAENEIVDFLPLPARPDRSEQDVLAVSLPKQRVEMIRKAATAAGLELVSLGYAPLGISEFVSQTATSPAGGTEVELVLALHGPRVEVLLLYQNQLLFCHVVRFNSIDEGHIGSQPVLAEITRALIAADQLTASLRISAVRIIGQLHDRARLESELTRRFQCPILSMAAPEIDGLQDAGISAENAAEFAVPIGMLSASEANKTAQINLLNPRQPAVHRDRRGLRAALVAALLLVVGAGGYLAFRSYIHQLELDKQQKQAELQRLEELLEHGKPVVDSAKSMRDWESRSVNWLDEMNRIGKAFPGTDVVFLQSWRFESVTGSTLGRIEADGYAAEREDVERLNEYLAEQQALRVLPREIGKPASMSPEYPYRFDLDIELSPPKIDAQREENQ